MDLTKIKEFLYSKPGYLKVSPKKISKITNSNLEYCKTALKQVREELKKNKNILSDTQKKELFKTNLQIKKAWKMPGSEDWGISLEHNNTINKKEIDKIINESIKNIKLPEPINFPDIKIQNNGTLIIYLSDQHIGAEVKDAQYENIYNAEVVHSRMSILINSIYKIISIYKISKIILVLLGDSLDGFNSQTTRGGFVLPQNMSNIEAFECFLNSHINLINSLLHFVNNIDIHLTCNSNHGGDFEYAAHRTLEMYYKNMPDVKTFLYTKFINYFETENKCYIITHGKDKLNRKYGLPKKLDEKTEVLIGQYIKEHYICKDVKVVKGDLHTYSFEQGKFFDYQNVPSFFGGSSWIADNFGKTKPGVAIDIITEDNTEFSTIINLIK